MGRILEPINNILEPGERILWGINVDSGTPEERHFVITDRRVYRRSSEVPNNIYQGAVKEYLKTVGNTLVIERIGVRFYETSSKGYLFVGLRNSEIEIKYMIFDSLRGEHINIITKILSDSSNMSKNYISQFASRYPELSKSWIIDIGLPSTPPEEEVSSFSSQEEFQPPLITPEKYDTPLITPEKYNNIDETTQPPERSFIPQRIDQSLLSPQRHYHLSEDFQQDFSLASNVQNLKPSKPNQSSYDEYKTTSQIVEAVDESLYLNGNCSYCNQKISSYAEKIFTCKECGVFYHASCLNKLLQEGYCYNCNRTLIY